MVVGMWMTRQLLTIAPDASIVEAAVTMARHHVRRLLVSRDGRRLLGVVSSHDVARACPPDVNPCSEMVDQLQDTRLVSEIMTRSVHTTSPDTPIEEAARLLRHHKVGALPVVREGALVGIITESDVFQVLLEMIGVHERGVSITFDTAPDEDVLDIVGPLAQAHNLRVVSLLSFRHELRTIGSVRRYAVVRLVGANCEAAAEAIWDSGHRVLSVQHG